MIQRYVVPIEESWQVTRSWVVYIEAHSQADAVLMINAQLKKDVAPEDLKETIRVTSPEDEWEHQSPPDIQEYAIMAEPVGALHDYPRLMTACRLIAEDNVPPQEGLRDAAYAALIETPLVAGLNYAAAEAELQALSDEDLEEYIQGEQGAVPVRPTTEAVLQSLFDQL